VCLLLLLLLLLLLTSCLSFSLQLMERFDAAQQARRCEVEEKAAFKQLGKISSLSGRAEEAVEWRIGRLALSDFKLSLKGHVLLLHPRRKKKKENLNLTVDEPSPPSSSPSSSSFSSSSSSSSSQQQPLWPFELRAFVGTSSELIHAVLFGDSNRHHHNTTTATGLHKAAAAVVGGGSSESGSSSGGGGGGGGGLVRLMVFDSSKAAMEGAVSSAAVGVTSAVRRQRDSALEATLGAEGKAQVGWGFVELVFEGGGGGPV
jgi:hypothetical protein